MTDEFGIAGKTLLVTGSGRNLGKAIVLEFAARGHRPALGLPVPHQVPARTGHLRAAGAGT